MRKQFGRILVCFALTIIMALSVTSAFADTKSLQNNVKSSGGIARVFTNANIKHYWRSSISLDSVSNQWSGNMGVTISSISCPSGTKLKLTPYDSYDNSIGESVYTTTTGTHSLSLYNHSLDTICLELRNKNRVGTIVTSGYFECDYV